MVHDPPQEFVHGIDPKSFTEFVHEKLHIGAKVVGTVIVYEFVGKRLFDEFAIEQGGIAWHATDYLQLCW